jgi:hypothetical protein
VPVGRLHRAVRTAGNIAAEEASVTIRCIGLMSVPCY